MRKKETRKQFLDFMANELKVMRGQRKNKIELVVGSNLNPIYHNIKKKDLRDCEGSFLDLNP